MRSVREEKINKDNYQSICNAISATCQQKADKAQAEIAKNKADRAAINACISRDRAAESLKNINECLQKIEDRRNLEEKKIARQKRIEEEDRLFANLLSEKKTRACTWEDLHSLFDQEKNCDEDRVAEYLNVGDTTVKKQDLNQVINDIGQYLKNPDNSDAEIVRHLRDYYAFLQQEKNNIPDARLSSVTEQSYRVLFAVKHPEHINNNSKWAVNKFRGQKLSQKNAKFCWGELLSSAADAVFGFAVALVAGVSIALTWGVASPVAAPLGAVGLLGMFGSVGCMRGDWKRSQERGQGFQDRADKILKQKTPICSK